MTSKTGSEKKPMTSKDVIKYYRRQAQKEEIRSMLDKGLLAERHKHRAEVYKKRADAIKECIFGEGPDEISGK